MSGWQEEIVSVQTNAKLQQASTYLYVWTFSLFMFSPSLSMCVATFGLHVVLWEVDVGAVGCCRSEDETEPLSA